MTKKKTTTKRNTKKISSKVVISEIKKSQKSVEYFIDNYVMIQHPVKGFIPFNLFEYQRDSLKQLVKNRFNIVLKSRQLGISTLSAAYILHLCLFHKAKKAVIVSQRQKDAADVLKKIKLAYKGLPDWMKQLAQPTHTQGDNIGSTAYLEFTNGSSISAEATTGNAARGGAVSLLVIDEAAAIDSKALTEMWASAYPTLSAGGDALIISTPRGVGNFYHRTWVEAGPDVPPEKRNTFNRIRLHWTQHPDYDEAWYEGMKANMTDSQVAQELDCSFENSGQTFIAKDDLKRIYDFVFAFENRGVFYQEWCEKNGNINEDGERTLKQIPEKSWVDKNYYVWERYQPGFDYVVGADVARGDGGDYSAAVVMKVETGELVAEYKGHIPPLEFGRLLAKIGYDYGACLVVVENAKDGYSVLTELVNIEYENIFWSYKSNYKYCEASQAPYENAVLGLSTTNKSRPLFLAKFEDYMRNNYITIYSSRMYKEMQTFIYNNGKAQAQSGCNDDLIMALVMAIWGKEAAFGRTRRNNKTSKHILAGISVSTNKLDTRISGMDGYKSKISKEIEAIKSRKAYEKNAKMYWPAIIKG